MIIIVYGPPECGKTRNAERLRKFFKMRRVLDGFDSLDELKSTGDGTLGLTNVEYKVESTDRRFRVFSYAKAARMAGIKEK